MRKFVMTGALLVFSFCLYAQKNKNTNPDLPAFGNVDKADLQMKECDFDSKAEAMILLDDGQLDFILGKGGEFKRRVRIKILNSKGLEWADVHLPYRSEKGYEELGSIEAQTYNLDASGNVTVSKLDKKLIYEKKLNKKFAEKVFTFPDVKVGSIIEYRFKKTGVGLMDWYFQRPIPVRYSRFVMDFPEELEVSAVPFCNNQYESASENRGTRVIKTYSMAKVPAFRNEPFIVNEDYYRDRLVTKLSAWYENGTRVNRTANWMQVIKFLMEDEDFGVQVKRNIPRTADLDAKLHMVTDQYQRMRIIHKYVIDNMEWNEYTGIWALDGVRSAWKDKKGTLGEINLILVNLLKEAGLDAHPMLVSTHENGIVNTVDAGTFDSPGFLQFDKVMAQVQIGDKIYIMDATQKNTPTHLIPSDVLMTQGLVIEKLETGEWGWKTLWHEDLSSKNLVIMQGSIDAKGKMSGEASISSFDYARLERLPTVKKGKEKFIEAFITEANPGMSVDEVSFENSDADSLPLIQKVKFTQPLNNAGEYQYFSINMLSGLEKNPFVADNRFSDVFFGHKQTLIMHGSFTIPDDFEFDELPKNIKMIMPDTSIIISRVSQVSNNILLTKLQLDFKKPFYPAAQYAELQEFYQRLYEILNEQFVVRKKKKA